MTTFTFCRKNDYSDYFQVYILLINYWNSLYLDIDHTKNEMMQK